MNGFHADGLTLKKVLDQRLKVRLRYINQKIDILYKDVALTFFFFVSGINSLMIKTCHVLH